MKQMILGSIATVLLAGCAEGPASAPLEYDAYLATRTDGVAFLERGDIARVGMYGLTCDVYASVAMIGSDYDYPGDSDHVLDAWHDDVLVSAAGDLWVDGWGDPRTVPGVGDPVGGFLLDDGVVTAFDEGADCVVSWGTAGDAVAVGSGPCLGLAADRPTGDAWVATADALVSVSPAGTTTDLGPAADLLAWDPAVEALYVAASGDTLLRALEADGSERWAVELPGPAIDLQAADGRAGVLIDATAETGEVLFYDGWTGEALGSHPTPSTADALRIAPDASHAALIRDEGVTFYGTSF